MQMGALSDGFSHCGDGRSAGILRQPSSILQLMTNENRMISTLSFWPSHRLRVRHVYTISQRSPVTLNHSCTHSRLSHWCTLHCHSSLQSFLYFPCGVSRDHHHNKLHGLKLLCGVWSWGIQFKTLGNRLAMRDEKETKGSKVSGLGDR